MHWEWTANFGTPSTLVLEEDVLVSLYDVPLQTVIPHHTQIYSNDIWVQQPTDYAICSYTITDGIHTSTSINARTRTTNYPK
jgi:hypothetical protein